MSTSNSTTSGTSTDTTTTNASSTAPAKLEITSQLVTSDVYGIFVGMFALLLTVVVLFTSGSILAVFVLWALIGLIVTVLFYYGIIDLERILGVKKEVKVEKEPVEPSYIPSGGPMIGSEVFHISQNQFTYDEAPAVCAAFGGQLATLEQVIEAYNGGAEWCGYGWTAGGLALYPTQKKTWDELQREVDPGKRTACGRPGVNGGYFDPTLKFGVNCFGFKPEGEFTPPAPVPGTDKTKFNNMVNDFKKQLNTFILSPFSRNEWSGYDSTITSKGIKAGRSFFESFTNSSSASSYGTQFKQDLGKLVEGFENADEQYVEQLNTGSGNYSANGPYGLRGDVGATGPAGPFGPTGPQGIQGVAGDVGPIGAGEPGPTGAAGPAGQRGEIGPMGPTGSQGPPGTAGSTVGVVGAAGPRGPTGPQGVAGVAGAVGPAGQRGEIGPAGPQGPQGVAGSSASINALTRSGTQSNAGSWAYDDNVKAAMVATSRIPGATGTPIERQCPTGKLPTGLITNYNASGTLQGAWLTCY